ncbi:MAG: hypothetical protein ABSB23_05120 [Bryobacteraceae bacterium]
MGSGTAGTATGSTGATSGEIFRPDFHIGFDRPEAWGLKYFASSSLLSGLQPEPPSLESQRIGSVTVGFELGWLPTLDAGQQRIGFDGTSPEDLNKAPIFARPVVRIALPRNFTALVAAPPPFELFGVTSRLLAMGLEHPIVERQDWEFRWRGYGQVGSVKGAFTCPQSVLAFAPGSANNPTACVGQSADVATLRYAGMEFQFSHRLRMAPRIVPHVSVGGNFIDGVFQVHAPVQSGLDETRMWTHGGTFSTTGGVTYLVTSRAAFTVDAFYSPLRVKRQAGTPDTNDGLFNVRALLSYTFR